MPSPKEQLEQWAAEKAELEAQLGGMEAYLAGSTASGAFGTHERLRDTTPESIDRVKRQIAELDELIEKMLRGNRDEGE